MLLFVACSCPFVIGRGCASECITAQQAQVLTLAIDQRGRIEAPWLLEWMTVFPFWSYQSSSRPFARHEE
jgi:hypothetical protein